MLIVHAFIIILRLGIVGIIIHNVALYILPTFEVTVLQGELQTIQFVVSVIC